MDRAGLAVLLSRLLSLWHLNWPRKDESPTSFWPQTDCQHSAKPAVTQQQRHRGGWSKPVSKVHLAAKLVASEPVDAPAPTSPPRPHARTQPVQQCPAATDASGSLVKLAVAVILSCYSPATGLALVSNLTSRPAHQHTSPYAPILSTILSLYRTSKLQPSSRTCLYRW